MVNPSNTQTPSLILEWRIENFSIWTKYLEQEHAIICRESSLISPGKIELTLYPRGKSGQGERMEVFFEGPYNIFPDEVELSFIGSDGSLLYKRRVNQIYSGILNGVLGPKFEDVVTLIEQKEDRHGDHLTLQFEYVSPPEKRIYMTTTLEVLDNSFQITLPMEGRSSRVRIASVSYYNCKSGAKERLRVTYDTVTKILGLEPSTESGIVSSCVPAIRYYVSIYDKSNVLIRLRKGWHVAMCPVNAILALDSLSDLESGGHAVLRLKIVSGNYKSHCCEFFQPTSPLENASKKNNAFSLVKSNSSFSLSEDLSCLYRAGEFPDFTLKCGTVSFPVHKNILRARSPVFKTMLSSDMIEAASGSVDIEDLDAASLDHFLTYLYTGTFKDVPCDRALKLYYAADKYEVPSLKKECAHYLCANVSILNVCDILFLGDLYDDDQLTSAAQNFILKHPREVARSKEWQDYMQTNPQLFAKTFTHFAANGLIGFI